jgi:hypothetical protein
MIDAADTIIRGNCANCPSAGGDEVRCTFEVVTSVKISVVSEVLFESFVISTQLFDKGSESGK